MIKFIRTSFYWLIRLIIISFLILLWMRWDCFILFVDYHLRIFSVLLSINPVEFFRPWEDYSADLSLLDSIKLLQGIWISSCSFFGVLFFISFYYLLRKSNVDWKSRLKTYLFNVNDFQLYFFILFLSILVIEIVSTWELKLSAAYLFIDTYKPFGFEREMIFLCKIRAFISIIYRIYFFFYLFSTLSNLFLKCFTSYVTLFILLRSVDTVSCNLLDETLLIYFMNVCKNPNIIFQLREIYSFPFPFPFSSFCMESDSSSTSNLSNKKVDICAPFRKEVFSCDKESNTLLDCLKKLGPAPSLETTLRKGKCYEHTMFLLSKCEAGEIIPTPKHPFYENTNLDVQEKIVKK